MMMKALVHQKVKGKSGFGEKIISWSHKEEGEEEEEEEEE